MAYQVRSTRDLVLGQHEVSCGSAERCAGTSCLPGREVSPALCVPKRGLKRRFNRLGQPSLHTDGSAPTELKFLREQLGLVMENAWPREITAVEPHRIFKS